MAELTSEQVDRAEREWMSKTGNFADRKHVLRTVAPFLQLPWDEPTESESSFIHSTDLGLRLTSSFDEHKHHIISDFVRRRNAALTPKTVDPRREKIELVLRLHHMQIDNGRRTLESAVDAIIAALDEVK